MEKEYWTPSQQAKKRPCGLPATFLLSSPCKNNKSTTYNGIYISHLKKLRRIRLIHIRRPQGNPVRLEILGIGVNFWEEGNINPLPFSCQEKSRDVSGCIMEDLDAWDTDNKDQKNVEHQLIF